MSIITHQHDLEKEIQRLKKTLSTKENIDPEDFNLRGELYRMSPLFGADSRDQDIINMKEWIKPKTGELSVDIAAGTGFMTKPLALWTGSHVYAVDPSSIQLKNCAVKCAGMPVTTVLGSLSDTNTLHKLGADFGNIDIVTSFGGIHHVTDSNGRNNQKEMFANVSKVLKPGGRFVAADVGANTALSTWFETVVKQHCLTGHEEKWLTPERLQYELIEGTDLAYVKSEIVPIQWVFETKKHMALFMKALKAFDLTEDQILEKAQAVLGFEEKDGKVYLNWPMLFFHLQKKQ